MTLEPYSIYLVIGRLHSNENIVVSKNKDLIQSTN